MMYFTCIFLIVYVFPLAYFVSGVITRPEYPTCFEFDDSTTFKSTTPTSILSSSSPHDSSSMLHTIM
ncbi:hypothetical protein L1887_25619 [Cichorium endivia]|nr:hypothetical protein L1887_25619 [Cichorium endivia]